MGCFTWTPGTSPSGRKHRSVPTPDRAWLLGELRQATHVTSTRRTGGPINAQSKQFGEMNSTASTRQGVSRRQAHTPSGLWKQRAALKMFLFPGRENRGGPAWREGEAHKMTRSKRTVPEPPPPCCRGSGPHGRQAGRPSEREGDSSIASSCVWAALQWCRH